MARKTLNRKELRAESEAAERLGAGRKQAAGEEPSKPAKRKSRSKATKEVRLKAYWGVFSQSLNPVVMFEYSERDKAEKKAQELSDSKKSPHFVQLVKKVIEE